MKGRIQKSLTAKRLTGDFIKKIPQYKTVENLDCPSWMPEFGKQLWETISPQLIETGILTEVDWPTFEALCLSYHLMRQAAEELAREGTSVKAERGDTVKRNPAFTAFKTNCEIYRKLAENFGLSPLSRQRLDIKIEDISASEYWAD